MWYENSRAETILVETSGLQFVSKFVHPSVYKFVMTKKQIRKQVLLLHIRLSCFFQFVQQVAGNTQVQLTVFI